MINYTTTIEKFDRQHMARLIGKWKEKKENNAIIYDHVSNDKNCVKKFLHSRLCPYVIVAIHDKVEFEVNGDYFCTIIIFNNLLCAYHVALYRLFRCFASSGTLYA